MRPRLTIGWILAALVMALMPAAGATTHDTANVIRDSYGVPHIFADTPEALFHAMGKASAEDRMWQAEILRRSAKGRMAEILGLGQLEGDIQARTLFGPAERRAKLYEAAPEELKVALEAYTAGFNEFIAAGDLPPEYDAFGFAPEPWTVDDSVAIFMTLGSQFGWFGSDELANAQTWQELVAAFGADAPIVFSDLFWLDDPDAPTSVPGDAAPAPGLSAAAPTGDLAAAAAAGAALAARQATIDRAHEEAGVPTRGPASNAMVIAPELSETGNALLLGGPQMGYTAPQINHEVGLHGPGIMVTGMTIAGVPFVPIGVGDGYAWTLTSGGSDNSDIYAEVLHPSDPTKYLYEGEWVDMDCREETFHVAGAESATAPVCATGHGPVIFSDAGLAFSLKNATYGKELSSLAAWIGMSSVDDVDEFEANLADVAYNFNVLYADNAGNIAYWHIGHIPTRPDGVNRFLPLDGTGGAEWTGIVPWGEMPHSVNPDQGWLASWNNKPMQGWVNSSGDFWMWGGAHRVNTFMNQARAIEPASATMRTLRRINRTGGFTTDTPTGQAGSVFVSSQLDELLAAVDTTADPRLKYIVAKLGRWNELQRDLDGDGYYDRPWGTIFNAWWTALAEGVFDEVWGISNRFIVGNLVDRMLRSDQAGLPLAYDYLGGTSVDDAVTAALIEALDGLTARYGSTKPRDWKQPISTITWSPLGAGGVPDTIWMNRGTYNQIVHLKNFVKARNVISPGQSGDPRSPHFADQLELYATWHYKLMLLRRAQILRDQGS